MTAIPIQTGALACKTVWEQFGGEISMLWSESVEGATQATRRKSIGSALKPAEFQCNYPVGVGHMCSLTIFAISEATALNSAI
jgi:hypothetical protein